MGSELLGITQYRSRLYGGYQHGVLLCDVGMDVAMQHIDTPT
jgi:hypothetical protein